MQQLWCLMETALCSLYSRAMYFIRAADGCILGKEVLRTCSVPGTSALIRRYLGCKQREDVYS